MKLHPETQASDPQDTPDADSLQDVIYLSTADERANTATHGLGILLSMFAIYFFWQASREAEFGLRVACLLFTLSMMIVYIFSTLSHAVTSALQRSKLRSWDQGTIYLLIAGTYSPFIWEGTDGWFRGLLFGLVWGAAAVGFASKVISRYRINAVSTITYVLLGWLPAIPLVRTTPAVCFAWMIIGGCLYSGGIFFLIRSDRALYSHAAWHIMVMLGTASHAIAIAELLELAVKT